jgi:YHS domain-containing protein
MARDPVCGMMVTPQKAAAKREYKGKTYYFCLPSCEAAFNRDPEKYDEVRDEQAMPLGGATRRGGSRH